VPAGRALGRRPPGLETTSSAEPARIGSGPTGSTVGSRVSRNWR
jgi:hypothetical protein